MNALITFGCSWTKGKFSWYDPNISKYTQMSGQEMQRHDPQEVDDYCFRTILSRRHDYVNINYAKGGSSNQRQFRFAEEYFNTDDYKKYNNVIVLWGITSTARMEWWSNKQKKYKTYHLTKIKDLKFNDILWTTDYYDHDVEVKRLSTQIQHWDNYFKMIGVKNYWFDTFNHHNYTYDSPNMIMSHEKSRDLMSNLCIDMGHKLGMNGYHLSLWEVDDDRIKFLRKKNLVNPTTHHPNRECHIKIADMLDKYVNFC